MENQNPTDGYAVLELLTFVPAAFLVAWFMAGFSIEQLCELVWSAVLLIPPAVQFVGGTIFGALFVWMLVRAINGKHGRRHMGRGSAWL